VSLKESFCLTRLGEKSSTKNQPSQYLETICSKIWHRTVEIAKQARISWKIIIVRVGGMTKNELSIWNNLKQSTSSEFAGRVQLVLACIDFNPALALSVQSMQTAAASPFAMSSTPFTSSVATFSQSSPAAVGNAYGTPVATPLAIANESPDPSGGLMSTPTGNAEAANNDYDPEVRWVDAMDEVWGIVLNHRVPACRNDDGEQDVRLALASGYLWPVKSVLPHNLVQVRNTRDLSDRRCIFYISTNHIQCHLLHQRPYLRIMLRML
jgi:Mediator complex subunit 13 C-terminal domain